MKRVALFFVAALVFAITAPAFAQPFADVPTDIFAFDAVAELAAKGIIEGYPDGTFKGDRAMTRYEMAMVVARILARIEAIKIPPAPAAAPPQVTSGDVQSLQRLLNEFRAELAAQGVRVTAVEEELAALRARLSNVKFSGSGQFRTEYFPTSAANGPGTGVPSVRLRNRLQWAGQVAPNVTAVAMINTGNGFTASRFPFETFTANGAWGIVNFGVSYVDATLYGLSWRLGRQLYTLAPIGLQGYGLLFDPSEGQIGGAPFGSAGAGYADGLLVAGAFGSVKFEGGIWRMGTLPVATAPATIPSASFGDFWTGAISAQVIPGWTIRLSGLVEAWNFNCINPTCPGFSNTTDTGYSLDASGTIIPGVTLGAAYASWTGHATATTTMSQSAWEAHANFDLGQLAGLSMFSPTLGVSYKNYGTAGVACNQSTNTLCPLFSAAMTDTGEVQQWNFQGWSVLLNLKFTPTLSGTVQYESGNTITACPTAVVCFTGFGIYALVPAGTSENEWYVDLSYVLASRTTLHGRWFRINYGATPPGETTNFYRLQLDYSW